MGCNCGGSNRTRSPQPPTAQVPTVVENTNQQLIQQNNNQQSVEASIQKAIIAKRKYGIAR